MSHETYRLEAGIPAASPFDPARVSLILSWPEGVHAISLHEGNTVVVGRSEPAQVVIADRSLSRAHARISLREGRVHIEDLGSTNGTQVNQQPTCEAFIDEEDRVTLGAVELRIGARERGSEIVRTVRSHAAWMRCLDDELVRARAFGRALAVLAVRHPPAAPVAALAETLRPVDRACAYAPGLSLLLLPEAGPQEIARHVSGLRAALGDGLALGFAVFPGAGHSAESLVSLATDAAHIARPGGPPHAADAAEDEPGDERPVIASAALRRVYDLVTRVSRTTLPVLILGETGSGKELVARALHEQSPRAGAPFKALNCATLPSDLLESVLFGHERGAFTGAERRTAGIFEQAQNGTVFLDEVGELSARAQAALLRVLEQRTVVRVGGTSEIPVTARVVAATHRDLSAMVRAGTFREDLMFRLDALTLRVPALRERREEIPLLAAMFLARARHRWSTVASDFTSDAIAALERYAWPGNVRQLRNAIERAAVMCQGDCITVEDLPEALWLEPPPDSVEAEAQPSIEGGSLAERVRAFEAGLIRAALDAAGGNQAEAARALGIPRRTLAHKVHGYGLHPRART